jgi:hypothetical protein
MFRYPVEKNVLRFYKYKFLGIDEDPIIIEAYYRRQARTLLRDFILMNPKYQNVPIINESLSLPIIGESTKNINGNEYVWIGKGWILLWEFEKLNID